MDAVAESLAAKVQAADRGEVTPPRPPSAGESLPAVTSPGAAPIDESPKWIEAALFYGDAVRELVPERAKPHWTDERLGKFGAALAACAKHYGWKFSGLATHPLLMLAAAGWPLAWPIAAPYVMPHLAKAFKRSSIAVPGDEGSADEATSSDMASPPA